MSAVIITQVMCAVSISVLKYTSQSYLFWKLQKDVKVTNLDGDLSATLGLLWNLMNMALNKL